MSDKEAFVNGALLCVQRYWGNLALPLQQRLPLAENEFAYTVYATIECLWETLDYGINKFYCITVSLQFML